MKTICCALVLYGFCCSAQSGEHPVAFMGQGYENIGQDHLLPDHHISEEEPLEPHETKNGFFLGLRSGVGLIGGYFEPEEKYIFSPAFGASAYYKFTKRSAFGLDVIYCNDLILVSNYRWMLQNLYLKIGNYYTKFYKEEKTIDGKDLALLNSEIGFQAAIGYQFNQMKWKPFMELQIYGLNITRVSSHIFMMSGGVMF